MSIESAILAMLISTFGSSYASTVAELAEGTLSRRKPVREAADDSLVLEQPGNRMGMAKKLVDGEEALGIYLEKAEGPAYNDALALQQQEPKRVTIEVLGFAQSVWPTQTNSTRAAVTNGLAPGSSIAHMYGYAGSLGAFVNFKYRRGKYMYRGCTSAAHVLFVNKEAEKGDPVISPGRPDGVGDIADKIGKLGRCAILAHYSQQNDPNAVLNTVDLATVELDDDVESPETNYVRDPTNPNALMPITGVLGSDNLIGHLSRPVYMVGRTSGFSEGILDAVGLATYPIELPNRKKYLYGELNVVKPKSSKKAFSAAGDSGALIYTADGMAAGFLVGGSPEGSLFLPAYSCLEKLESTLIV
jgi:hypothetical protein